MRVCDFCGQIIDSNQKYCPHCGTRADSGRIISHTKQSQRKLVWLIIPIILLTLLLSTLIYRSYSTSHQPKSAPIKVESNVR